MSVVLIVALQSLSDDAIADALEFEANRIVVQEKAAVAAYATLRYVPQNSRFAALCPDRIELPASGLPWYEQSSLKVSGIPERFREKNRVIFSPLVGPHLYVMRPGDELSGVIDLTSFFKRPLSDQLLRTADERKLRVSCLVQVYSNSAIGQRSTVQRRLESDPKPLSIAYSKE